MTTELVTSITALDQSKESADQGTLDEIKKQSDLYRTTLYTLAEMLRGLNEKKDSLQGLRVVHLNGVHKDLNGPMAESSPTVAAESTDGISLINEIEELDVTEQRLTQELIEKCSRIRDKYREGVYALKDAITSCQKTISELEEQLASEALLRSAPSESSSSTVLSPEAQEKRQQIQILRKEVAKVKNGRISDQDRDAAIQNYIFLLFVQEKNSKKEQVDPSTFDPAVLSAQDKALLREVAQRASQTMDPKSTVPYDFKGLFRTKARTLDGKIIIADGLRAKFGKNSVGIAQLEGHAKTLFSHFFVLLKLQKRNENTGEPNYRDFIFSRIGFLAGDLLLAEKIYDECRAYYEETRGRNDPQLMLINETISQIKEVQRLFLTLLQNSQVR